ncbi:phytase [Rhodocista pekingensis]|uniref:Phytase n=1 Tax=Rhodocista pekingensis TaxID=201185 RepID=A0ABW2KZF5_9PROT
MPRLPFPAAPVLALLLLAGVACAAPTAPVSTVQPALETAPGLPDTPDEADADDPAVWLHPTDPARSLIITAVKDAGLRVYDLQGRLVQRVEAARAGADGLPGRYNNVDVAYGLALPGGGSMDVAVASDRGRDRIMVWRIDPDSPATPLADITDPDQPRVFPTRRAPDGSGEIANPATDQRSAYGLTTWKGPDGHRVIVAQRKEARLVEHRLVVNPDGTVGHVRLRHWDFPYSHRGQSLTAEDDHDPARDWQPQFEGLVVDQERGILFAGQEDVGLWRVDLKTGAADAAPFHETRGSIRSPFDNRASRVARDVEGLALYYGPEGTGYLVASSQGDAHGDGTAPDPEGLDDTFAVFERGGDNRYLGSFRIVAGNGVDGVQECDGAEIVSYALPGFPDGLMVVQDGYNDDLNGLSGEPEATNFKYVDWKAIAGSFDPALMVTPQAWSPRSTR